MTLSKLEGNERNLFFSECQEMSVTTQGIMCTSGIVQDWWDKIRFGLIENFVGIIYFGSFHMKKYTIRVTVTQIHFQRFNFLSGLL